MNDPLALTFALTVGAVLGVVYYGGLWWTVRKGVTSTRPALWFFCSMLARTGAVLVGFYLVSGGHWERLLACLPGFVVARVLVVRFTGPPVERYEFPAKESGHAS